MDQQVFKFVERRLFHGSEDRVHGLYGDQVFRNLRARANGQPIRLRVLDPAVVAHGMNLFWLRAHESQGKAPVVAHANGVDGKEYFLRDRGHWYLEDFRERFHDQDFLTYDHPPFLSLAEDFQHLVEALVVAAALGRRLVLPSTMNCGNCPALAPYGAVALSQSSNCTFDYFAWSQSFLGHHGELVAESGLRSHPAFAALPEARYGAKDVRAALGGASGKSGGRWTLGATAPRRVHLREVRAAYRDVLAAGFGPWEVFECRFHDWPVGWMACRDQRFVRYHGRFSRCEAREQAGCGYRGVTCCEAFWGWGEKLEYFTGRPWDLPCNCGLPGCQERPQPGVDAQAQACCSHGSDATLRCDRRIRQAAVPEVNTPEDTESLTSTALAELSSPSRNVTAFWHTCRLNRQLRFSDRTVDELVFACHRLATRFLLLKQNLEALGAWCRFAHGLRRGSDASEPSTFPPSWPRARDLPARDAETGAVEDWGGEQLQAKVAHDLAQIEYLHGLPGHERKDLRHLALRLQAQKEPFPPGLYLGRAAHVPELRLKEEVLGEPLTPEQLRQLALRGHVVVDGFVQEAALTPLGAWLAQATIWHMPGREGRFLEARLLDGLNCEALIDLLTSLVEDLGRGRNLEGRLVLEDAWARKYDLGRGRAAAPVSEQSWRGSAPDLLATLSFFGSGGKEDGLELEKGGERQFLARRHNRLILWTSDWRGTWSLAGDESVGYASRPIDVTVAFRRSLGHRLYPGWTAQTSRRWPASLEPA